MPIARHWTDAERETLETMIKEGHTFRAVGSAIGVTFSTVREACKRFGIVQPHRDDTEAKLVKLSKNGITVKQASEKLGKGELWVLRVAIRCVKAGKLHKAGPFYMPLLFSDKDKADAYTAEFQRLKKEKERKRAADKRKRRAERLGKPAPKRKAATKPEKTPVYAIKPSKPKPAPMPTNVIWPESVKVTVIPTPPSRFAFEPPEGWRGAITSDWMDRRLSQTGRNYELTD